MKILHVIENMDESSGGGATERTRQLSIHFSRLGHDVTILTTSFKLTKSTEEDLYPIKIIPIPILLKRFYIPRPLFIKVRDAVKAADIIHIVSHWSLLSLMTYLFISFYKKKYTVSPLGALPIYGRSKFIKRMYNYFFGKRIIRNASFCIVATLNETPAFTDLNVDKEKIIHIPNGINEEDYKTKADFDFRKRLGLEGKPFILFMGRLNQIKGPDILLKAFNNIKDLYPDLHLVYIGPDEGLLESLESYSHLNGIGERVHFLGYVSREDKSRLINETYFLTVPSRKEAMSIVVLEAGIAAKPALITDQCGFNEIEQISGGYVVPATVEGLANGIKNMMNIGDQIKGLGLNLKNLVSKNYLWSSAAKKHLSVFEELINIKGGN